MELSDLPENLADHEQVSTRGRYLSWRKFVIGISCIAVGKKQKILTPAVGPHQKRIFSMFLTIFRIFLFTDPFGKHRTTSSAKIIKLILSHVHRHLCRCFR